MHSVRLWLIQFETLLFGSFSWFFCYLLLYFLIHIHASIHSTNEWCWNVFNRRHSSASISFWPWATNIAFHFSSSDESISSFHFKWRTQKALTSNRPWCWKFFFISQELKQRQNINTIHITSSQYKVNIEHKKSELFSWTELSCVAIATMLSIFHSFQNEENRDHYDFQFLVHLNIIESIVVKDMHNIVIPIMCIVHMVWYHCPVLGVLFLFSIQHSIFIVHPLQLLTCWARTHTVLLFIRLIYCTSAQRGKFIFNKSKEYVDGAVISNNVSLTPAKYVRFSFLRFFVFHSLSFFFSVVALVFHFQSKAIKIECYFRKYIENHVMLVFAGIPWCRKAHFYRQRIFSAFAKIARKWKYEQ